MNGIITEQYTDGENWNNILVDIWHLPYFVILQLGYQGFLS
jgi:hypothetical protein